jgi:hypothetical protein
LRNTTDKFNENSKLRKVLGPSDLDDIEPIDDDISLSDLSKQEKPLKVSAPSAFRRSRTLKTEHFHIDKYIDQWWKRHKLPEDAAEKEARLLKEKQQREAEEKEKGPIITDGIDTKERVWQVAEVDERVHHFIHELLMLGEDDPAVKNGVHLHKFMIQH